MLPKCAECSASNGLQKKPIAAMRRCNVGSPFKRIALDISGPFVESD